MRQNEQGNSMIFVVLAVLMVVIVGASAFSYYLLQSQGKAPAASYDRTMNTYKSKTQTEIISNNDELDTLSDELDTTDVGEIDADINNLNSSASSL